MTARHLALNSAAVSVFFRAVAMVMSMVTWGASVNEGHAP
jgi:hypothetical protein